MTQLQAIVKRFSYTRKSDVMSKAGTSVAKAVLRRRALMLEAVATTDPPLPWEKFTWAGRNEETATPLLVEHLGSRLGALTCDGAAASMLEMLIDAREVGLELTVKDKASLITTVKGHPDALFVATRALGVEEGRSTLYASSVLVDFKTPSAMKAKAAVSSQVRLQLLAAQARSRGRASLPSRPTASPSCACGRSLGKPWSSTRAASSSTSRRATI